MRRQRYTWTEARIQKYLLQGRGLGTGTQYHPWLTVSDVPSLGRSHRCFCPKTGRTHHLLSDGEYAAFLNFWWEDGVSDIREQFPIRNRIETQELCIALGVSHPKDPITRTPIVMTTDFVVTRNVGMTPKVFAYAVKNSKELEKRRTKEKLAIEEAYWTSQGIPWELIRGDELKDVTADNLAWILDPSSDPTRRPQYGSDLKRTIINACQQAPHTSVSATCAHIDSALALPAGKSLRCFRQMLAYKEASVDLAVPNIYTRAGGAVIWRTQ